MRITFFPLLGIRCARTLIEDISATLREFPRYWVLTYVGPSFLEPIPVLAFFGKLTVPSPGSIDAPLVVRTSFLQGSNQRKADESPRHLPHKTTVQGEYQLLRVSSLYILPSHPCPNPLKLDTSIIRAFISRSYGNIDFISQSKFLSLEPIRWICQK